MLKSTFCELTLQASITKKPRAIGTVQIQVLNLPSQGVLSRTPSQQFDHPMKG
jgi:hypothetical protein